MKKKIIFVDDEENVLSALKRSLRSMTDRWEMDFVTNGVEALNLMDRTPYDVIVSDMQMPGMSGEELLNAVKERYPATTRIVLSGQCNQATAFRLVGSDHFYLSKPCPQDLFISTIEQAIRFHLPKDGKSEPLSNEKLTIIMKEFAKNLLLRGVINVSDVPEILQAEFSSDLLEYFAPVLDKNTFGGGTGKEYVSDYLDTLDTSTFPNGGNWLETGDDEEV